MTYPLRVRRSCTHYELKDSWDVAQTPGYLPGYCAGCQAVVDNCEAIYGRCSLNLVDGILVVRTQEDRGAMQCPQYSVVARWEFVQPPLKKFYLLPEDLQGRRH